MRVRTAVSLGIAALLLASLSALIVVPRLSTTPEHTQAPDPAGRQGLTGFPSPSVGEEASTRSDNLKVASFNLGVFGPKKASDPTIVAGL
ncbi:MAG TPA: hypothetical protein VMW69_02925, partial [Spirochaetia bacterium]|nr:hypothetical protein [Spirochaetia bacterium]